MAPRFRSRSRDRMMIGQTEIENEIFIPHEHTGRVIGKGGATLERIREETRCQISIEKDPLPDDTRRVTIRGLSGMTQIAEALINYTIPGQDQASIEKEVYVPEEGIGRVIGKGGSMLDRFRRQFQVDVKVSKEGSAKSVHPKGSRSVQLSGSSNAVNCVEWIMHALSADPDAAAVWTASSSKYQEHPGVHGVGGVMHGGGMQIGGGIGGGMGNVAMTNMAPMQMRPQVAENRMVRGRGGVGGNIPKSSPQGNATKILSIPSQFAGGVVGPQGQSINLIRSKSGCQIHVKHDKEMRDQGRDAIIEVGPGSAQQIQVVERLLQERVNKIAILQQQ